MKRKSTKEPSRVYTHPIIAAGKGWIFYVRHDATGIWSFLPQNHLKAAARCIVPYDKLLALDKTIRRLVDLPRGWHAWRQHPHGKWEQSAIPTGPTHLLICEAIPSSNPKGSSDIVGGFLQCWIRCKRKNEAMLRAKKIVTDAGWQPITDFSNDIVREETTRKSHRKYYKQVQIDGQVFVIFEYTRE